MRLSWWPICCWYPQSHKNCPAYCYLCVLAHIRTFISNRCALTLTTKTATTSIRVASPTTPSHPSNPSTTYYNCPLSTLSGWQSIYWRWVVYGYVCVTRLSVLWVVWCVVGGGWGVWCGLFRCCSSSRTFFFVFCRWDSLLAMTITYNTFKLHHPNTTLYPY